MAESLVKPKLKDVIATTSNALECGVCRNPFNADDSPRLLPCSHSLCVNCIEGIIATQNRTCPYCRENFKASSAEDLPLNRNLLDITNQLSYMELWPKMPSVTSSFSSARKSFEDFNEDFRNNFTKRAISACKDAESKVEHAVDRLKGMKDVIERSNDTIGRLMMRLSVMESKNYDTLDVINKKVRLLKEKIQMVLKEERKIKCADERLGAAKDFATSGAILDKSGSLFRNAHQKVDEIEALLQETDTEIEDLVKKWINVQKHLRYIAELIGEKVEEDISKVYVEKTFEGIKRVASLRVGLKGNLCLRQPLDEEDLPKTINLIKLESLMKNKTSRRVFLDLEANGRFLGRLIIKLRDDGHLALNFLHMCIGDLGQSYAHSPIFSLANPGRAGESVTLGKYYEWPERKGQRVSRPVLKNVNWAQESRSDIYKDTQIRKGDVRGFFERSIVSKFSIILRGDQRQSRDYIGTVQEGLSVLSDAIMIYPDYDSIKISNCGIIFNY